MRGASIAATRVASVGLVAIMLNACTATGGLFARRSNATDEDFAAPARVDPESVIAFDSEGLGVYLLTLQRLIDGDSLTQAEIINRLRDDAEFAPTKQNRFLYALALAIPGHNGADAVEGARRLRDLLAAGPTLTPEERSLAQMQLQTAEQLEILEAQSRGFDAEIQQALAARDEQHAAELRRAQAETAAVRQELEDTTAMLDAITNIERSISEREDDEE